MKCARICVFALCFYAPFALAGQANGEAPLTQKSPYLTMLAHLYYLQPDSYEPPLAARTLYGVQDSARAVKLAVKLKQVLDGKGLYVRMGALPRDSNYIDSTSNQHIYTPFPRQLPEVYLERVNGKWYYSAETVGLIPELHKEVYPFGADFLLNLMPKFGQRKVLGLALWQYCGLLAILLLAILAHFILSRALRPVVHRISRSRVYPALVPTALTWRIARAASVLIVLRLIGLFLPPLQLPIESANFAIIVMRLASVALVIYILLKALDVVILYADRFTKRTESKMDEQLLPVLKRAFQFLLFLAGGIQALRILQADITTLIAGISIGGLALALAAQDMLKNLFGSLTIFMDRPFQIGDWINFSDVDGTVEEVGFRSTRVRTFANSLVYVPNGKLADMVVNNFGLRAYRRFSTNISITYDTPPALIEKFTEGLKGIVANHPKTRKDYYEIHLNEMSSSALNILFYIFFDVPSWTEELKAKHEILIAVIELGQSLGVRFAFPTQTLHVEELPGATSLAPHYQTAPDAMDKTLQAFLEQYRSKVEG